MIQKIFIGNFKVHKSASLNLEGLTVLTGMNGMGKSSVIQALLLLRQSYMMQKKMKGLVLNGDLVKIGNYQDALCESGDGEEIIFKLGLQQDIEYVLTFSQNMDKSFLPLITDFDESLFSDFNLFNNKFQYIAAEHLASQESYTRNTFFVEQLNQISEKNGDAKYAVHFLFYNAEKNIISERLAHPQESRLTLKLQVEAWLQEISPSIRLKINENLSQNTLALSYQFETELGQTKEYKPENVGFGVSYVLPILVAILTAEPGTLLLIENPEAHLHPAGQAIIGRLLCLAAQCGVQIIIETHSDHIINSILVLVKKDKAEEVRKIDLNKINIYFISRQHNTHISTVHPIKIREDGKIINPPNMFFDQFSKDMKTIMGF